jgi:hypothetical protein
MLFHDFCRKSFDLIRHVGQNLTSEQCVDVSSLSLKYCQNPLKSASIPCLKRRNVSNALNSLFHNGSRSHMVTKKKVSGKAQKKGAVKAQKKAAPAPAEACATSTSVTMSPQGSGIIWTTTVNPSNPTASAILPASRHTSNLFCTNLGITGVPPAAPITSVTVRVFKRSDQESASAYVKDYSVRLVRNGVALPPSEDADIYNMWPLLGGYKTYSKIKCWNVALKGSDVMDPNFGFLIAADYVTDDGAAPNATAKVSQVKVTVCWEV